MSPAEIFFRIGTSLGGWVILLAHGVILAVLPLASCSAGSPDPWRGTALLGIVSGLMVPFLGGALPWKASLRWVLGGILMLLLYDAWLMRPYLGASLAGTELCQSVTPAQASSPAGGLLRLWAPLQLIVVLGAVVQGVRYWLPLGGSSRISTSTPRSHL